jgi:phage regulator Rha-like protein
MTLRELKDFMSKLPEEMDNFMVVNGEVGYLDPEDENTMVYRVDNPIVTLYVDEQTQEICMFHQTKEDVTEVLKNNGNGNP